MQVGVLGSGSPNVKRGAVASTYRDRVVRNGRGVCAVWCWGARWSLSAAQMAADLQGLLRPGMSVLIDEAQRPPEAGLAARLRCAKKAPEVFADPAGLGL